MDEQKQVSNIFTKISSVYKECKTLAEKYEYKEVWYNTGKKQREIVDEYAKQVNISNKYRQKLKDLEFLMTILQELKSNLSSTPSGKSTVKQVDSYIENIKSLLKVYQTIEQMQITIVRYYEKGGASF